ncbi:SusC/RagA family TonB-linked outer membrane protein [Pontibacter sp. E15-1]|uniref:SusC/RagA family TonB-linked outer membrane protein n=1 Tax=Pontibacter sp. E15-1 TaxID=2919918 RepID=UPI001F4F417F|nr:SusC/RagA family TonB-linked outer membrane protein [Pontibacter sp. E15-1]MCJ8166975.1 SusC/RagA family TonB-linked outer membrane protein [Pontibacter sp. E15-1]
MKKSLLLSVFFAFLLVVQAWAQSSTVSGRVTDQATSQGLPGVSVIVKGTTVGATTSVDGSYTLNVPENGATLLFRYVGYKTQEVSVNGRSTVNVQLLEDSEALSEVVVVGYSTTTQQSFTGSAKVVSGEKLESKNVSNVSQAIAGEVAGVRVINTSGQPGTEATVRIRGIGSVNGNRAPLYVVDGVPFSGSLNSINPADIASTTILKDAAATAIYGSRGANGVVVITTKSGKGKKSYIEADANFGTNMSLLPRYNTIKSPEQYIGLSWEGLYNNANANPKITQDPEEYANERLFSNSGVRPGYNLWNVANGGELIDPVTRTVRPGVTRKYDPENWEDYGFQSSGRQEMNVKFGGSSDKTSYYSSFGYLEDKGYIINSGFQRLSARLNVSQEINKWLNGALNFNYSRTETNNNGQSSNSGSIFWFADNIPSIYPLFMRDAEGQLITDPIFGGNQYDYGTVTARGFGGLTNAIADATYDTNRNNRNELNGSASLNFNLAEGLTFENRLGAQYYHNKFVDRGNKYYGGSASQNGSLFHRRTELFNYNLLNLLRYGKTFGEHNVEALAAHEATNWSRNILTASGYSLVDPQIEDLSNAVVQNPSNSYTEEYSLESYFAQVNYDFNKKYFLSTTIRRDGSSRFRKDKWGTFGSVGAAWLVSNEDFMNNLPIFSSLKLKASYGLIGDQAGVGYYPGYDLYNVDNLNDAPAFSFDVKGNPDLTWETSKMFQTGVEFGLGRYLTGAIDYYVKNTDDLIFERRVGPSIGYALIQVNDGNLKNRGLEFDLTGNVFEGKDYRLSLNVNGEIFSNEITKMPIDPSTGNSKIIDVQNPYAWSEGHSIYDFYVREWAGVDPLDGRGMWTVHYEDANGNNAFDEGEEVTSLTDFTAKNPDVDLLTGTTKVYSQATQKYIGKSALPDVRGAFNLSAGYKGFDLSAQLLYSVGGYAYDYTYAGLMHNRVAGGNNWHTDILDRWQQEGDITDIPRISNDYDKNVSSTSSRFITKANYLALNNVRLSYTLPTSYISKFGIGGLSVWVSGDNLWINTARDGFNPSTSEAGSSDTYRYSPLSTVTAGLRVKI